MSRQKTKNSPKVPITPPEDLEPDELTGFAKAWATWLQPALAGIILLGVLGGGYYAVKRQLLPSHLLGTIAACSLLVVPILSVIQQTLEDSKASLRRKLGVWGILVLVALGAYAPVVWLSLPTSVVFEGSFEKLDQRAEVPSPKAGVRDWVAELTAELDETLGGYESEYGLRIDSEQGRDLMKGKFERRLGVRRETGEKEFYSINQALHRFTLDLSPAATLRLYRTGTGLTSLHVRLREQLASWCFLLVFLLPLMLLASATDATEPEMRRVPFYTARLSFMVWFGFIFANTTTPHDFAGALLVSAAIALILALGVASVLPRIVHPILHRFRR